MNNTEKFIAAFNNLQAAVAEKVGQPKTTSFKRMIDFAEKNNDKVIIHYKKRLNFYREFRNLLVHNNVKGQNVASPAEALIDEVKEVTDKIAHPKKVRDLFKNDDDVISFDINNSLTDVLKIVDEKKYSQFPVFKEGNLEGIISANGITNFLAKVVDKDVISISETTIADVIQSDEQKDSFEVISQNKSIYDIESIFSKRIAEGRTSYVLLITSDGLQKPRQKFIGIITPWDLPKIVKNK